MQLFELRNPHGLEARITDYGAILTAMRVPDRHGRLGDVVHGFDAPEAYRGAHPYFGAIVGRVANRIAHGRFELDGESHTLAVNEPPHHLHGGWRGWDRALWQAEPRESAEGAALALRYRSRHGEEGYPGHVRAQVLYTLTSEDALQLDITATSDRATPLNLAHHVYWNLGGTGSGSIRGHRLRLFASRYTPSDATRIPTGEIAPVVGTPFDFTREKPIGQDLDRVGGEPAGYDVNFVVDGEAGMLRRVAQLTDSGSGRVLELLSDQPGVQLYTGNGLDGSTTGKGARHLRHSAVCLETQHFPDAIHKPAWREGVILRPGCTYRHRIVYRFRTA